MSDRSRLDVVQAQGLQQQTEQEPSILPGLLRATFQQISNSLAGADAAFLPPMGAGDVEAQGLVPSVDPDTLDLTDTEEFTPDMPQNLPENQFSVDTIQGEPFDFASLPQAQGGKFLQKGGKLIFTTGVGEAPNNKSNRNNPVYERRAEFVSEALNFVTSNFDAASAGQYRDMNAEVTANRSHNSDHYSGGAFDVRTGSREEAQRVLAWASQQPWVSFAQIYEGGTLVHISANVAAFGGGNSTSIAPPPTPSAPPPSRPSAQEREAQELEPITSRQGPF